MNTRWTEFLKALGATTREAAPGHTAIHDFGNPGRELLAARDASIVAPLSHLGLLEITGSDAADFLHGQFSSDVNGLAPSQAQTSAYCSPKGRVLANFLLWREPEHFGALLSIDVLAAVRKRLAMYVLRSRVSLEDASEHFVVLGVAGPIAANALSHASGVAVGMQMSTVRAEAGTVINLGGERYLAILRPEAAEAVYTGLAAELTPVGEAAWRWLDIRAGVPWITTATQDQFVPQMANLELTGAVNFQKGCYPGQEIVARTQYLGKLKRRLFLCHTDIDTPPEPATNLYAAESGSQACGMVVNAATAPGGGCDLLAVMQIEAAQAADNSPPRLNETNGPALTILELPYLIPQAA